MKTKLEITQVVNGLEYEGTFSFNEKIFLFKLLFRFPIKKLDEQVVPEGRENATKFARELFQFSIKHSDNELPIDDQLFGFLLSIIGLRVIAFYNDPQTIDMNESSSICGELLDPTSNISSIMSNISMSIGCKMGIEIPDDQIPVSLQI
ncbi:MAG: hypothetical protein WA101_01875 [Minisyncoccia bacterium]